MATRTKLHRVGYGSALLAFVAASAFVVVQLLQLAGLVAKPWDEILIYGTSQCITIPALLAFLALHHLTPTEQRFWSHAAVVFAVMYVAYVTLNYAVQLAVVIPSAAPDPVLVQSPHSLFWTVDALGYIMLGLATGFAMPLFGRRGLERWVRGFFLANLLVTPLIAFVYFYPTFSETLLLLGLPWGVTAPGSMLVLALFFESGRTPGSRRS